MFVIALTFAALIFIAEPRDNVSTLGVAMWMVIVTMTTVGYGDNTPETQQGYIIVALLMVVSVLYMAMPIGIVGNAFGEVWRDRDRLLFFKKLRAAFIKGEFSSAAVRETLMLFDTDNSGFIEFHEFTLLVQAMSMNLPRE